MATRAETAVREVKTISGKPGPRKEHEHDEHSLAFVLKGATAARIGGERLEAGAGQLVLIAAGVPHECRPVDPASWGYTLFLIVPGRCAALDEALARSARGALVLDAPRAALEALRDAGAGWRLGRPLASGIEAALTEATRALGASARAACPRVAGLDSPDPRLAEAEAFMRRSLARNPSLEELGRVAGIGKYELVRAFKAAYGLAPHAYHLNLRINGAKGLLRSGLGPAEAAFACGFCDQSHFTRAFSLRVGLSPAEYARMYKTQGLGDR